MLLSALAVLCPPLAVAAAGRPAEVAANIVLTTLFYIPGLVHALAVVDQHQTTRRNEALLRAVAAFYG